MAGDRAVKRRKKEDKASMKPVDKMTKLQKNVVHWLRRNVPTKKTKFLHSHEVSFFIGSKAVDALLNESPWAKDKVANLETAELYFEFREQCVEYLDELLKHKMFHRAKKIPVSEPFKPGKKKKAGDNEGKTDDDEKKDAGGKKGDKDKKEKEQPAKKKRKIRLDMHLEQIFVDSQDAYVWLYDPVPWHYWAIGTVIVLGVIGVCLFPLWPPKLRQGVHYLSVAAAGFLVFIIGLAVFKYVIFCLLFALSGGKLKFWIFPNLTEDVGFFESFMPLYDYTYTGGSKKAKDSDDEESDDSDSDEESGEKEDEAKNSASQEEQDKAEQADHSESDDSTSKKSSTGKDFEMVDKNDTDVQDE